MPILSHRGPGPPRRYPEQGPAERKSTTLTNKAAVTELPVVSTVRTMAREPGNSENLT